MFRSVRVALIGLLASSALGACGSDTVDGDAGGAGQGDPATGGAAGRAAASAGSGAAMMVGTAASGGSLSGAGNAIATAGMAGTLSGSADAGAASAGAASGGGGASTGGTSGGGGASTGGTSGGAAAGSGGSSAAPPSECNLPTPVSFQKNIQGFLTTSCGKAVSGGCHVTDTSKTSLGYDHAYDWITAIAHTGSCGKTQPYVKRFEVVLALIAGANPPSCPNSRQMPPPGMGTPLTACQIAALRAWLAEPMVSQMHVPVSDDTKDLYPAGAYLMPPFN